MKKVNTVVAKSHDQWSWMAFSAAAFFLGLFTVFLLNSSWADAPKKDWRVKRGLQWSRSTKQNSNKKWRWQHPT